MNVNSCADFVYTYADVYYFISSVSSDVIPRYRLSYGISMVLPCSTLRVHTQCCPCQRLYSQL